MPMSNPLPSKELNIVGKEFNTAAGADIKKMPIKIGNARR